MKQLKITDLSIGDWVDIYGKVSQIRKISKVDFSGLITIWGASMPYGLGAVIPIPITPQILEQNGFKANEHSDKVYEYNEHNCLVQYFFVNHKLCIRNNNAIDVEIHSVHQLQHALRLAGIDKEIRL